MARESTPFTDQALASAAAFLAGKTPRSNISTEPSLQVYPDSFFGSGRGALFLARTPEGKRLITVDADPPFQGSLERVEGHTLGVHPLSAENAALLRASLPHTRPAKLPKGLPSFGCGDRLGLANPGHLRTLKQYRVAPILAQQSIRELNLTGRTFTQVIDAATWAVLQEGYRDGFGADGDHLKSLEEVQLAVESGVSMITLDLSLVLGSPGAEPCPSELQDLAGRTLSYHGECMTLDAAGIDGFWRTYSAALAFVMAAEAVCRAKHGAGCYDLEISVDETPHTTLAVDHLLLALECRRRGIDVFSMAPRFPGEFQKGIDYRGDLREFEAAFAVHAAIAAEFGYKISVHSGSDKFAVFPIVARLTGGSFHEKTAGTSWLEACRVAAQRSPDLFRRIYTAARGFFPESKKYYHIVTELPDVPSLDGLADKDLPGLLEQEASRQYLHITYGQILRAPELGPALMRVLETQEEAYYLALDKHFRRHLDGLGIARR